MTVQPPCPTDRKVMRSSSECEGSSDQKSNRLSQLNPARNPKRQERHFEGRRNTPDRSRYVPISHHTGGPLTYPCRCHRPSPASTRASHPMSISDVTQASRGTSGGKTILASSS